MENMEEEEETGKWRAGKEDKGEGPCHPRASSPPSPLCQLFCSPSFSKYLLCLRCPGVLEAWGTSLNNPDKDPRPHRVYAKRCRQAIINNVTVNYTAS